MGSVYSLGGIANLGESWTNDTPSVRSTPAAGNDGANPTPAVDVDPTATSTIPVLSRVEALKGSNPSEFQQVVSDAVTKLKVEARQTTDPFAASYLWNLANRFQLALDSGDGQPSEQGAPASVSSQSAIE
jgi:hypothetical protein